MSALLRASMNLPRVSDFEIWCLPIQDLVTGRPIARELLSRGKPGGDWTMPAELFDRARAEGIVSQADRRCLEACIAAFSRLPDEESAFINVFAETIIEAGFAEWFAGLLQGRRILPGRICLAIHHALATTRPDSLARATRRLRSQGVRIALDDMKPELMTSAGWSLQPDFVKIDRCVLLDMPAAEASANLLRIKRLEGFHNFRTIVEGIATRAHLDIARHAGIALGEGFLFGDPEALLPTTPLRP